MEADFQSLTAKAKAKKHQHLHITQWHSTSWQEAQLLFGFAAQDIPSMEECFRLRLSELVPDLPRGSVELVRSSRGAWMADGKTGGMRVYTTAAGQLRIWKGLHESKHPDTSAFWSLDMPSNPPCALDFKWTTGSTWTPDTSGPAQLQWAPPAALAVVAVSTVYGSIDEAADDLEAALVACERVCLPASGQTLQSQAMAHPRCFHTLRQALPNALPSDVTWEQVVEHVLDCCPDMVRNVDGETQLLESIVATPLLPQASPLSRGSSSSRSPEPSDDSNRNGRPASGGGQSQ
eukprot:3693735-Rhodomonas_salina.1